MGHIALSEPESEFIAQLYSYLRCIASVTSSQVPSELSIELNRQEPTTGKLHPLFGFAESLYRMLPPISLLVADKPPERTTPAMTAREVELSLQSWFPAGLTSPDRLMAEAEAASFATQRAVLFWLAQTTQTLRIDDPKVTRAVDNILSALSLIRPGSETDARTLFPLFMAGVGSTTKANRLTVEYRLNIMETTVGFGHIITAHKLLDDLWRRRNEGEDIDWRLLMRVNYPGLVLF